MYLFKDPQIILNEALNILASQGSITNLTPGSKARAIVEAVTLIVGRTNLEMSAGISQTLLPNATGAALDLIGEAFGVTRLQELPARVEASDNNFKYYVRNGTFGNINNGNDIVIPKGTQIYADANNFSTYFVQRDSITLPAAANAYYFAADQGGRVLPNAIAPYLITRHGFTGYTQSQFNSLLVANEKGVAGRPLETDDNLRYRIRKRFTETAGANETAIRLAALQVPGVSDIKILPNRAGLGTVDVVVFGINPVVGDSTIAAVQNAINNVVSAGSRGIAVPPRLTGISLSTSIKFKPNTSIGEKNQVLQTARSGISVYITNLNPGQTLVINQLTNIILDTSDKIIDIGTPGKPFDSLYLWKSNRVGGHRYSRFLEANYLIQDDEEVVVEPFIANPIDVIEAL